MRVSASSLRQIPTVECGFQPLPQKMSGVLTEGTLTPAEEASMAYCEHHSVEVRRSVYTFHENMKQITSAIQVMERINNHSFLDVSTEGQPCT